MISFLQPHFVDAFRYTCSLSLFKNSIDENYSNPMILGSTRNGGTEEDELDEDAEEAFLDFIDINELQGHQEGYTNLDTVPCDLIPFDAG